MRRHRRHSPGVRDPLKRLRKRQVEYREFLGRDIQAGLGEVVIACLQVPDDQ